MFYKKSILKKKKPSTKVFSCEFCKIFIYKHLIAQLHVTTYETIEFCMQKKKKPSTKVFSCEFCIAQLHVTTYETIEFCMQKKKKKKKEAEDFRKIISMQT